MQKVNLCNSNLQISQIGFGCMGMSEFYGRIGTEAKNIALLHKTIELGVNFLDTADIYDPFHNERLVGKAIKDCREGLVIATKFGIIRSEEGGFLGINGQPEYVRKNSVPISGTKKEKYLIELDLLSRVVKGGRYDDRSMGLINAS